MVLRTKEENRTNAQDKPLRLRAELVHLFPLVVQKLSSLIITEFTKYKSNSAVEVQHLTRVGVIDGCDSVSGTE